MSSGSVKAMREIVRKLRKQGFHVQQVPNGHYKVVAPSGDQTQISFSPKSPAGVREQIRRLKRLGYQP